MFFLSKWMIFSFVFFSFGYLAGNPQIFRAFLFLSFAVLMPKGHCHAAPQSSHGIAWPTCSSPYSSPPCTAGIAEANKKKNGPEVGRELIRSLTKKSHEISGFFGTSSKADGTSLTYWCLMIAMSYQGNPSYPPPKATPPVIRVNKAFLRETNG